MILDCISNGFGAQSMLLWHWACIGRLPATVSLTGDTGSENDRICSDGRRMTSHQFFHEFVKPMGERSGLKAYLTRAVKRDGSELPAIHEVMSAMSGRGNNSRFGDQPAPLHGSEGGRMQQSCTDRWKMAGVKQQARRLGATVLRSAIGIHRGEAARRMRGRVIGKMDHKGVQFSVFQTCRDKLGKQPIKWLHHYYPLVEAGMGRQACRDACDAAGVPYLLSSECDMCPHKDGQRWLSTSSEVIEKLTILESKYDGEWFLTKHRVPLPQAIEIFRREASNNLFSGDPDFGCVNDVCGI